jgi:hypothetical protein
VLGEEVERPVTRSKLQSLSLLVFIVRLGCETALFLQHQQKRTQNKITRLEHHWRTYMTSVVVEVTAKKSVVVEVHYLLIGPNLLEFLEVGLLCCPSRI